MGEAGALAEGLTCMKVEAITSIISKIQAYAFAVHDKIPW